MRLCAVTYLLHIKQAHALRDAFTKTMSHYSEQVSIKCLFLMWNMKYVFFQSWKTVISKTKSFIRVLKYITLPQL